MSKLKTLTILFRTANTFERLIKSHVNTYGLSVSEFGVLEALYHKGDLSVQEIVDKVLIANSSMSYVLTKLQQSALVKRRVCTQDKRRVYIALTNTGNQLIKRLYEDHEKQLREHLDLLDSKEEETLQSLLKKIGKTKGE